MTEKVSKIIIILLLLAIFLTFLDYAFETIFYPYDWMHSAGYVPFYALRLLEGKPIYADNEQYPIMCNPYPPVFPAMTALLSKTTGDVVTAARGLSFIMSLLTGLVIFLAVKKETSHNLIAVASALFYFAYMETTHNFPSATSNSAFVFFSILGVFFVRLADEKKTYYILGFITLILAAYTRQSAFYACAAACIYVFLKSPKKGLLFGLSLTGAILIIFFVINNATDGWFYENVIVNHFGRKIQLERLWHYIGEFAAYFFVPVVLALAYSAYSIYRRGVSLWVIFFLFAFAEAFSTGANGVGTNMLMPAVSAVCVLLGLGACELKKLLPQKFPSAFAALIIILIQFLLTFQNIGLLVPPSKMNLKQWQRVEDLLKTVDGPILFDRAPVLAMRLGKTEHLVEPIMLMLIEPSGRWKGDKLIEDIRQKKFKAAVTYRISPLPAKVQKTLSEFYRPVAQFEVTEMTTPMVLLVSFPEE